MEIDSPSFLEVLFLWKMTKTFVRFFFGDFRGNNFGEDKQHLVSKASEGRWFFLRTDNELPAERVASAILVGLETHLLIEPPSLNSYQ